MTSKFLVSCLDSLLTFRIISAVDVWVVRPASCGAASFIFGLYEGGLLATSTRSGTRLRQNQLQNCSYNILEP